MHGGPATAVYDHGLRVPGLAPASPPTVTGFLGGRGGSQCRVTPTSDRFRRFAPRWTRRSDRPPLSFRQRGATVGPHGGAPPQWEVASLPAAETGTEKLCP